MNRIQYFLIAAMLATTVGCGSKGGDSGPSSASTVPQAKGPSEVKPGDEGSLMPLKQGNEWVYAATVVVYQRGRPATVNLDAKFVVAKSEPDPNGGTRATLEEYQNNKLVNRQEWVSNSKGIYQLSLGMNPIPFSSPEPVVLFPLKKGDIFKWEGTTTNVANKKQVVRHNKSTTTLLGMQQVDTDDGTYNAYAVESNTTFTASDGSKGSEGSSVYFSPGIGLVRYRIETSIQNSGSSITLLKLKSHKTAS